MEGKAKRTGLLFTARLRLMLRFARVRVSMFVLVIMPIRVFMLMNVGYSSPQAESDSK